MADFQGILVHTENALVEKYAEKSTHMEYYYR